ncbi:ABC transporter permease [Aquibacillus rhizosphaerae]|uniref:ABC transporter permease n=1 Tax=Aquibacillus rhizosphaerae TaxID=3051431 RepID=A0ABT7LAW6_9BACI|nr:ABC transporter permease [Aquibacillus sp. LR5S19]MDL4842993.1 ABC transporter permease [Aquibacillus sp. LR5S19]
MLSFLKKDVLVLVRDRTELLILLLMPIILTVILGFALKGMFGGEQSGLDIEVAIVNQDNTEIGLEDFSRKVSNLSLPEDAKNQLIETAEIAAPFKVLEEFFESKEISEAIKVHDMKAAEATEALEAEEVDAVLTVPSGFTYQALMKMLLDQGEGSELLVEEGSHALLSASIFHDIVTSYVDTMNIETAIAEATENLNLSTERASKVNQTELGGKLTATDEEAISSMEYYAIGMAVMFALYVASTIAGKAYVETYQHVFDRILLSGKHPILYLSGKAISTSTLVFLQVVILFAMARFILQAFSEKPLSFWIGMLVITLLFAICIGGFGALLTAITLRFKSNALPAIFSGGIVSIFALLGGSFVPTANLPEVFGILGNWTPNGIMLSALQQWSQGLSVAFITPLVVRLLIIAVITFGMSLLVFSKRRAT